MSADKIIERGTEILSINGDKSSDIIENILRYIPGEKIENKTRKLDNSRFAIWYRSVYGNCKSFEISYRKGMTNLIQLL